LYCACTEETFVQAVLIGERRNEIGRVP